MDLLYLLTLEFTVPGMGQMGTGGFCTHVVVLGQFNNLILRCKSANRYFLSFLFLACQYPGKQTTSRHQPHCTDCGLNSADCLTD